MTRKSHNKKRNVGVIYEQLVKRISRALVEGDQEKASKCTLILKKHFKNGTELYKEWRLFNSLIKTHINSDSLATRIIQEAKRAAKSHDNKKLEAEKSSLIRSINYELGETKFYNGYVKDYKQFATVQTLLNEWRQNSCTDFQRMTEYENKVHAMLLMEKASSKIEDHKVSDVNSLTVKLMTEKFNKVYGDILNSEQQSLIKEYIFSQSGGDSVGFKKKIKNIKSQALQELRVYSKDCRNLVLNEKITRVQKSLEKMDLDAINDTTIAKFLSLSKLCEELRGDTDE